jgi:ribosomal protein S18 acetylase RimI-like enzyme
MSEPLIRPATPGDAEFIAWTIQAAMRSHVKKGWFDIMLARPEAECLEFVRRLALAETPSWWHHSLFLIAEVDGKPASALCRFRAGDGYPLSERAMMEVVASYQWSEAELKAMWRRGAYAFTCIMPGDDNRWTIENVATLPEYRGRGLVGILIEHALEDGRRRGFTEAQITFLIGNDPAERAYTKAGFTFEAEKRHPDHEAACGSPGLRRFRREL